MPKDYFEWTEPGVDFDEESNTEQGKEAKVIEFIYQVSRKSCDPGDYVSWLQDGTIIEEVIFKSCPTPLGGTKKQRVAPDPNMTPRDRIEKVINDLFEFGVAIDILFDVDDLMKSRNIPKVTKCLLEMKMMIFTGQGRSRLKSVQDVVRAPFRCSICKEKFNRSDQLKHHLCDIHPEKIGPSMRSLLQKYIK